MMDLDRGISVSRLSGRVSVQGMDWLFVARVWHTHLLFLLEFESGVMRLGRRMSAVLNENRGLRVQDTMVGGMGRSGCGLVISLRDIPNRTSTAAYSAEFQDLP